jgi:hypothetical protein
MPTYQSLSAGLTLSLALKKSIQPVRADIISPLKKDIFLI